MQHSIKDDYINSIKNYTNQFEVTNFRRIACNDFKSWPSPREETWRLSRLGSLSRKKIKPINPNLKKFLDTNTLWKQFFSKNKEEFKNIRERLIEISHKLGMSVTDFKKLVSRVQKGEKESRIAKKEMVEANLRLVI